MATKVLFAAKQNLVLMIMFSFFKKLFVFLGVDTLQFYLLVVFFFFKFPSQILIKLFTRVTIHVILF